MHVVVIGTGFVGVVSAAVFASFGNRVFGLDIDQSKVQSLNQGQVPFHEPGLTELLQEQLATQNFSFTTSYQEAIPQADIIIIAVGTPSAPDGTADTKFVEMAIESLAPHLKDGAVVCVKSTVPPGIFSKLQPLIQNQTQVRFGLAALPEFLREGSAVNDTLHPSRVVIGCEDDWAVQVLTKLHEPFQAPIVIVKPASAQMGKYSANAYLAQRITFINQVADLCEKNGADVQEVIEVIGHDERIGEHYWYPGLGYGGSCFPKDVSELAAYSRSVGESNNIFNKIDEINSNRVYQKMQQFGQQIGGWTGKKVAVLGLSFKPNTDDTRVAPALKVIPYLLHEQAQINAYDPLATPIFSKQLPPQDNLSYATSLQEAVGSAQVIILLIEWPEIVNFDYQNLPNLDEPRIMIDVRNQLDSGLFSNSNWRYIGIGRN